MKLYDFNINNTIVTMIRTCYGRFNSYRTAVLGMQEITELFQYVMSDGIQ